MKDWLWKIKIKIWFHYAKNFSIKGTLIGLIPCLITWCLWKRRCKARMERVKENEEKMRRDVRFWMKVLVENLSSIHKLSMHDIKIMEELQLDRPSFVEKIGKIVT